MVYRVIKNSRLVRALKAFFDAVIDGKENPAIDNTEKQTNSKKKPAKNLLFRDARIKKIAHEYYQMIIDYGVESASVWLDRQLKSSEDISLFRKVQYDIAKKYGFIA